MTADSLVRTTLEALWSEHCFHGTLKSPVRLRWKEGGRWRERRYGNLLNDTIFAATRKIRKPWVLSAFRDNAGVVGWGRRWALAAKVETHNHPSALDPVHGAATGLGGVIRDILGAGRGARPCLTMDVFGVGPGSEGRRTLRGLVAGVREYGNRIGTPTAAGAVLLDEGYEGLPLVFCGALGVMPRCGRRGNPRSAVTKRVRVGDAVVLVGGRTGRDGLGGAVFASRPLTPTLSPDASVGHGGRGSKGEGVIQRGDPLTGRCLWVALLRARDENLYGAVTDLGAGGIAVAAADLASWNGRAGIEVGLDLVPTRLSGLKPEEIWLSESQERMLLAVPSRAVRRLQAIFAEEASEATVIGRITGNGVLTARWRGRRIVRLGLDRIRHGPTLRARRAVWAPERRVGAGLVPAPSSAESGALRAEILRQYDHEIQGGTIGKPLLGPRGDQVVDAVVIRPVLDEPWGVAVATGIRIAHESEDPYAASRAAVSEAVAKVTAAGADRRRVALLDNVAWGNTDRPDALGSLARALQGLADGAVEAGAPFISGKDSLRNTRITSAGSVDMPGTILVTALGFVPGLRRARL